MWLLNITSVTFPPASSRDDFYELFFFFLYSAATPEIKLVAGPHKPPLFLFETPLLALSASLLPPSLILTGMTWQWKAPLLCTSRLWAELLSGWHITAPLPQEIEPFELYSSALQSTTLDIIIKWAAALRV